MKMKISKFGAAVLAVMLMFTQGFAVQTSEENNIAASEQDIKIEAENIVNITENEQVEEADTAEAEDESEQAEEVDVSEDAEETEQVEETDVTEVAEETEPIEETDVTEEIKESFENRTYNSIELMSVSSGNVIGETTLDNCEDFSNVWSYENFTVEEDGYFGKIFKPVDKFAASEIVWKTADTNKFFSAVSVKIELISQALYPVLYYSADGVNYTPFTKVSDEFEWKNSDWTTLKNGNENNWYNEMSISKLVPDEARYIKLAIAENSIPTGQSHYQMLIRSVNLSVETPNVVAESTVDECLDLSKVYKVSNITMADTAHLEDVMYDKTYAWGIVSKNADTNIVYKAADGRAFSEVEVELSCQNGIIFPVISWSYDGVNYLNDQTEIQTSRQYSYGDWKNGENLPNYNVNWHTKFNVVKTVPQGVKYIKISTPGNPEPVKFIDNIYYRCIKLKVNESGYVYGKEYTEDFSGFANLYSNTSASAENGEFSVNAGGELTYAAIIGSELKTAEVTLNGTKAPKIIAYDKNMKEIEFEETPVVTENDGTFELSCKFPSGTRYVKFQNADQTVYTSIKLNMSAANTVNWLSLGKASFTVDKDNILNVTHNVLSEAGKDMEVSAVLVIKKDGNVVKIKKNIITVPALKSQKIVMGESDFTENMTAQLYIIDNIKSGYALGEAEKFER